MKLHYLRIQMTPWLNSTGMTQLRIDVATERQDYAYEQIIPDNDLASIWDYIWQRAGLELKQKLTEEQ